MAIQDVDVTAAEFLGPALAGRLTSKAAGLKVSQLGQLRAVIVQRTPPEQALADLSLADLHSIRDAFAPYASQGEAAKMTTAGAGCCCCCCPCCCCGCACSSCCV